MYPDQPQQTPLPQGIDYLNSITPQTKTKTLNPLVLWGLIAATLVTVILVIISVVSGGNSPTKQLTVVGASASNLKTLAETSNPIIQSSELRSINSSLIIVLTNTNRDLAEPLKKQEINLKNTKKDKTVASVAAGYQEINERLEDARLNGVHDRTYVREVSYLLKTLHSDMEELYHASKKQRP